MNDLEQLQCKYDRMKLALAISLKRVAWFTGRFGDELHTHEQRAILQEIEDIQKVVEL